MSRLARLRSVHSTIRSAGKVDSAGSSDRIGQRPVFGGVFEERTTDGRSGPDAFPRSSSLWPSP